MPQHKRGPWSQTEDNDLLHLVHVHGAHNWVRISQAIGTRSPKQCRERYHQNLKPNLNHEPITPEEGLLIEQMVAEMGKRWAEIARRLRGRSDNAVKNWWNGGLNRRRRSNPHRRAELEVRSQAHDNPRLQSLPLPGSQFPLPSYPASGQHYSMHSQHLAQQYYGHQFFHPNPPQVPAPIRLPSNAPPQLRTNPFVETPLQSPSAFSQISAENAPSLVSDSSSISQRSPHHGTSPVELPPLSRNERRRQSSTPMVQMGVPGSFIPEGDYGTSTVPVPRFADAMKQPRIHHDQFAMTQQQSFSQATPYLPSQHQHPSGNLSMHPPPVAHQYQVPSSQSLRVNIYPAEQHEQPQLQLASTAAVQLPSISNLAASNIDHDHHGEAHLHHPSTQIDPLLAHLRCTPVPSAPTPDGSPKDKMSLSNLTH